MPPLSPLSSLDLIESSPEIRNTKVTIKFSIIKDSSPFKMVKKKHTHIHTHGNEPL